MRRSAPSARRSPSPASNEECNLICRVADEVTREVRLSDEALSQIIERYGPRESTELILLVSYYNMVSRFLESTRVELEDEPPLGWHPDSCTDPRPTGTERRMRLKGRPESWSAQANRPARQSAPGEPQRSCSRAREPRCCSQIAIWTRRGETAEIIASEGGVAECVAADWTQAA